MSTSYISFRHQMIRKTLVVLLIGGLTLLSLSLCTAAEHPYIPGQVLVKFDPDKVSAAASANAQIGAETILDYRPYGLEGLSLVRLSPNMTVKEAVAFYSSYPGVAYAEPDHVVYAEKTPNDPNLSRQWGLSNTGQVFRENRTPGTPGADIHALPAWDRMTGNHSSTIGVIDSGVDIRHPDLNGNLWVNPDTGLHGLNIIRGEKYDVWDDLGHGTHCSGIIGMIGNNSKGGSGVNWNISIASIKVINTESSGKMSDLVLAILYASSVQKFPVISCSIAGPWSNASYEAIQGSSSLIVAAAGNSHSDANIYPMYPACYNLSTIIAVAATDSSDNLTDFSNYGNRTIHVAAPGQDIYSTFPSIYTYDPVWNAESGNLTPWNITGNYTVDPADGYPDSPSISISRKTLDFEPVILEMKKPVLFNRGSNGDELYLHYRVDAENSLESIVEIDVFSSADTKQWSFEGKIPCIVNSGWNQGFINIPDYVDSQYYRLVITVNGYQSPVQVHLGSVGVGIRGEVREAGYAYMDGTSMATPFVSGMAAMIHEAAPDLTAPEIKNLIMETADPRPALQGTIISGGRVNLSAALDRIASGQVLSLAPGWNFISIPKKPASGYDTFRIFAGIDSGGHSVLTYHDNITGWQICGPDDPLKQLEGYWIYSKNQTTVPVVYNASSEIPVRPVITGWNAAGGWADHDIPANETLSSLGSGWSYVYGYDAGTQQYEEVIIRGGTGSQGDSRPIKPGKGYWVYATVNGTYEGRGI